MTKCSNGVQMYARHDKLINTQLLSLKSFHENDNLVIMKI